MPFADVPVRLDLRVGEEYALTLPGLGVTGHVWLAETEGPEGVIATSWKRGFPPGSSPPAVGVAAPETLHVRALAPGELTLNLAKRRLWERNVKPLESHRILVSVRDASGPA